MKTTKYDLNLTLGHDLVITHNNQIHWNLWNLKLQYAVDNIYQEHITSNVLLNV